MQELGLPTPKFTTFKNWKKTCDIKNKIGFPLIVKPTDLNSGIGCTICHNQKDIDMAFINAQKFTKNPEIIFEEYIQGTNHAANVFFQNQKIVHSFFDNEQYYKNPYLVAGASSPSNLLHYTMNQVCYSLEKITKHLNLVDGMFHVQFVVDSHGTAYLIDPCRRIPGGLYILFSQYASGFNVAENVVRFETGEHKINFSDKMDRKIVAREYIMTERSGIIKKIAIDESISKKIFDHFIWAKEGDIIKNPLTYKAGILFMEFENFYEMHNALKNFYEKVRIEMF